MPASGTIHAGRGHIDNASGNRRHMEPVYFLIVDGQKCGPYRKHELIDAGLEDDTLVWYEGREDWIQADRLVGFRELLDTARKERKERRKIQRQVAQLPDPDAL